MAKGTRQTPPAPGFVYRSGKRDWYNPQTGQVIGRREYDKTIGRLKKQGYTSNEAQAASRRELGIEPGPGRGRILHREFKAPVYDSSAPNGWRLATLDLNKRDASLVGRFWQEFNGGSIIHTADEFKRTYNRRVLHDRATGTSYRLVGDMDLLTDWYDSLDDAEREELWEELYRKEWRNAA